MAKTVYFDCFSGASGDMVLGALLDAGLPLDGLRGALGSLAIDCGPIGATRVLRAGVSAMKFETTAEPELKTPHPHAAAHANAGHVHAHPHDHAHDDGAPTHHHDRGAHRSLKEIEAAIGRSALSAGGKRRAVELFERLAAAESAIHGIPIERVHLHEVGALDSIVDIVGAVYGMEWLGAQSVMASPLNVGGGTVHCEHGVFPVPAPATARLLSGVPIYSGAVQSELVTPTGALLVTAYADSFGPLPPMRVETIGYGAGGKDFPGHPNVLRLMVGESAGAGQTETIVTLECEIDDMNPQLFGPLMDRLYEAGAVDVFYSAVQMKKNRPGTLVTVVAPPDRRDALTSVLFAESTTIGVRYQEMSRERLDRELRTIDTRLGPIRFKVASRGGRVLNASPEFEDIARVAAAHGVAIKDVQALAYKAWLDAQ